MAKDKERKLAEHYYVEKGCTAKETAERVGVTEATIGAWVAKGGWKARRDAIITSAASRCENLQQVISEMADQRIALLREMNQATERGDHAQATELRKQMATLDDGVAKWNKSLENAKKMATVPLHTYLSVMEQLFNALREFDEALFLRTIDFQTHHVERISANQQ